MVLQTISHYKVVRKLGAGGMGEVYLATDTRLDRQVALKLLPAEFTQDAERVRRFMQEAKAASALNHPNIISVYDIGESEAGRFLVMELVAGRTLRAVIAEDNSLATFLPLGTQMAKALSAAHAAGITHRDIKPDNIMVRDDGYVKVLDFGLARLLSTNARDSAAATLAQQTRPGTIMGTVAYMSPEQARGEAVSHPSDIFALGIVLYQLATGRHPFQAETIVGYLHAITLQTPPPPQQWQPRIPTALNALLLRMLDKEASRRPSATEVAQTLLAIEREGASFNSGKTHDVTRLLEASIAPGRVDIAHVLFCDIVGYSLLPIDRQKQVMGTLQALVQQTEDYRSAEARGQLVRLPAGDGMALAFLQDVAAPVRCACEIAQALQAEPDLKLRIGIHSGAVSHSTDINANRNIVGSGINLAQRVMDCGDAGHILLSRHVAEVLEQLSQWQALLHDLGEHEVKHGVRLHLFNLYGEEVGNPALPQRLRLATNIQSQNTTDQEEQKNQILKAQTTSGTETGNSIAVLPFTNMSADDDNEYFCDGLAEELLNALSKIEDLKVAARTSAFSFKGKNTNVSEIGRQLSVKNVLEGSVRKSGNRLRISVQLINASDGFQLWSERYDREMRDIFDLQDELTLAVVDALKLTLFGDEKAAILKRYTKNAEAYGLFLKGRYYSYKYTAEGWKRAIEFFEKAIEIQPDYTPAYAGMAASRGCLWFFGILPAEQTIPQCKADNIKALELDENLAEAHLSLAMITFFHDWEWEKAEKEFKQSIALNPNNAEALSYYAMFLAFEERFDEATTFNRRSLKIDPLSSLINMNVGWTYFSAGMSDEAASQADKMIEIEPDFFGAYWLKGAIRLSEGEYEEAVEELKKAVSLGGHQIVLADLGSAYSLAGKEAEAEAILDRLLEMRRQEYVPAICLARIYSRIGENAKAIEWLEKAFEERNGEMVFLKGEIAGAADGDSLNSLANDPRLIDLLQKMQLP